MKFILPLLFIFLTHCLAEENPSSIIVEDYVAFLSSTPGADQYYNGATMQDQIERIEEGGQIVYRMVEESENQPMLGLTEIEKQGYFDWEKTFHRTTSPLMLEFRYQNPEYTGFEESDPETSRKNQNTDRRDPTKPMDNDSSLQERTDLKKGGPQEILKESEVPVISAEEIRNIFRQHLEQLKATHSTSINYGSLIRDEENQNQEHGEQIGKNTFLRTINHAIPDEQTSLLWNKQPHDIENQIRSTTSHEETTPSILNCISSLIKKFHKSPSVILNHNDEVPSASTLQEVLKDLNNYLENHQEIVQEDNIDHKRKFNFMLPNNISSPYLEPLVEKISQDFSNQYSLIMLQKDFLKSYLYPSQENNSGNIRKHLKEQRYTLHINEKETAIQITQNGSYWHSFYDMELPKEFVQLLLWSWPTVSHENFNTPSPLFLNGGTLVSSPLLKNPLYTTDSKDAATIYPYNKIELVPAI